MTSRYVMVDTSAWIGLFLEDDEWHVQAVDVLEGLRRAGRGLVTTTDIFDETVTAIRRWATHKDAVRCGRTLRASRVTKMAPVSEDVRDAAWARFEKTPTPVLSYTDCTTMLLMDEGGIDEIFTFDDDFRRTGYTVIPGKR